MKTARVQWLLENIGSLEGDDLKEAEEVAKNWFEISDDDPVPYDRKKQHPQGPDLDDSPPARKKLSDYPPGTPMTMVIGGDGPAPEYGREDAPPDQVRIAQLEATVKDLYAKLTALEARLGVGKDG